MRPVYNNIWPPELNKRVIIYDKFAKVKRRGEVVNLINPKNVIIKLDKNIYVERALENESKYNNGIGHYLLLPNSLWEYESDISTIFVKKPQETIQQTFTPNLTAQIPPPVKIPVINSPIPPKLDKPLIKSPKLYSKQVSMIIKSPKNKSNDSLNETKILSYSKTVSSPCSLFSNKDSLEKYPYNQTNNTNDQNNSYYSQIHDLSIEQKKMLFRNASNINSSIHETQNPFYIPLLTNVRNDYFSEHEIDMILSTLNEGYSPLKRNQINILNKYLEEFVPIESNEIYININKKIALFNLIENSEDEINEGSKIKKWIEFILKTNLFKDLEIKIHSGYVYIIRKGTKIIDNITSKLVPNINYLSWQYDNPIDYHSLKYIIMKNINQSKSKLDFDVKKEAEDILSQEYIIALQPSPYFVLWTIKRLIMVWYANPYARSNIRKIKILINQFRADPIKRYNVKFGIQPQILIYPKYGKEIAKKIILILNNYFSPYIFNVKNQHNIDLFWNDSHPAYFKKYNDLIYYTNGYIDLKNYIKQSGYINERLKKSYETNLEAEKELKL